MAYSEAFGVKFREVDERTREGKPTRVVRAGRVYPTDQTDLWDALTNIERIRRWFSSVSGELHLGGRYQIEGNASGTITRCDEPEALDVTWELGSNMSWVMVRLATETAGTRLTLEHEIPKDEASEAHWAKYGPGATGVGWDLSLFGLGWHINNDDKPMDREAGLAWMASNAGKDFMRESAQAWSKAHINSGEIANIAQEMAAQTAAFYTGES